MENLTNSAEEVLIDSLSFKLPSSGQYITDRRSCTFHTEGSNSYSASAGTKVIRFRLAGDGQWMDPSTFRIMFDVVILITPLIQNSSAPSVKLMLSSADLGLVYVGKLLQILITIIVFLNCFTFCNPGRVVQTMGLKSLAMLRIFGPWPIL